MNNYNKVLSQISEKVTQFDEITKLKSRNMQYKILKKMDYKSVYKVDKEIQKRANNIRRAYEADKLNRFG